MNFNQKLKKAFRESRNDGFFSKFCAIGFVIGVQNPNYHRQTFFLAKMLKKFGMNIANFYLAKLSFLYGNYTEAKTYLFEYLAKVENPDAAYLLSKIHRIEGNRDKAWQVLESALNSSNRLKTWLMLANFVDSIQAFQELQSLYKKYENKFKNKKNVIEDYLIIAAARAKNYEIAKKMLQNKIFLQYQQKTIHKHVTRKNFLPEDAANALKDIKEILDSHGIEMFLVSGTFLGCVREGKILGHDQDVDVGVWSNHTYDELASIISSSGKFVLHEPLSKNIVKAKHLNGILVDVFIHYKEDGLVYHEGVKTRWANKSFELVKYDFLGEQYLGAKDYDTYLTENYGDWKTPNKNFDYILDTPNLEIINKDEYILHLYKLLLKEYSVMNKEKIFNALVDAGEAEFVDKVQKEMK